MKTFAILSAALLSACATTPRHTFVPATGPQRVAQGQLQYAHGTRSIIGDLTVVSAGHWAKLEFSKGPAVLLAMQKDATHARFEGPLASPITGGAREHTLAAIPPRLAPWLAIAATIKGGRIEHTAGSESWKAQLSPAR